MAPEAKVGLLVIVVAILAIGVAVYLSGALRDLGAYQITVQFADVQGLSEGAPVRLGGVNIGRVTRVQLRAHKDYPSKPAAVKIMVEPDAILYRSDSFNIKQGALVGDKYLSISRAPEAGKPRKRLDGGDVVGGGMASSTEVVMDEMRSLVAQARVSVDAINAIVTDLQVQEDFKGTVANLQQATARAVLLSEKAMEVVDTVSRVGSANEQRLGVIMQNLVIASEGINTSIDQIRKVIAANPLPAQMAAAGENLRAASENMAAISATTREQVETTTIADDSEAAVSNIREASEHLRQVSERASELAGDEQMSADIRTSLENVRQATEALRTASEQVQELITDEQMTEDLQVAVHELRRTAESGRGTMEQAQRVMTDVEGTMEKVRNTQALFTDLQSRPRFELRGIEERGVRADASFDLRQSSETPQFWRIGLRDIEDDAGLELQYCAETDGNLARVGLFGGELGLGYDWQYARDRAVESDLYNLDDVQLDLRWRLSLAQQYDLLLGLERGLDGNHPMLGIRYEGDF